MPMGAFTTPRRIRRGKASCAELGHTPQVTRLTQPSGPAPSASRMDIRSHQQAPKCFHGDMEISHPDLHQLDSATSTELADLDNAACRVDSPWNEPVSGEHVRLRLHHGWDGRGVDHLLLARGGDTLVGFAEVELPFWDNTHMGYVELQTHPENRGLGYADALFDRALDILRDENRTLLLAGAWADSHRAKFWERHGLEVGLSAAQRRLVMADLDWPRLESLLAESQAASSDYDIIEVPSPAPDELMPQLVDLQRTMNDAPLDDLALEDDVWNEERLRGFERAQAGREIRLHRLVARRRTDGEFGGFSVVGVEEERPWLGSQGDTAVVRGHRGHRLGLRIKLEMLQRLAAREPQIVRVDTWNAESNSHMIAVNELLGCVVVGRYIDFQKKLT